MASSLPDANLTRAKELGKYSAAKEVSNGKPHENSRILAVEEADINRICAGCGKHMRKVKSNLVCACKKTIHCSKDCLKSSGHKCEEPSIEIEKSATQKKVAAVVAACRQRYLADRKANQGPSSDKITRLLKGGHRRILNYAERGNPVASYLVGSAYAMREFERTDDFAIPSKYREVSIAETNEMAVEWLTKAAQGDVPEAMFLLFITMMMEGGLRVDHRVAYYWLVKAHATGSMDYLVHLLELPMLSNFPLDLHALYNLMMIGNAKFLHSQALGGLLLATRYRELEAWDGKTGMGEPFYGRVIFKLIMEFIGKAKTDPSNTSFINGEKKVILVISARPGYSDFVEKCFNTAREENNLKFMHGVKERNNPDYQLVGQTSNVDGRTKYLISCKHKEDGTDMGKEAKEVGYGKIKCVTKDCNVITLKDYMELFKRYTIAGECEPCVQEAKQRLRAVSLGQFSISLFPVFDRNLYAARYSTDDGVIVQDVFAGNTKPCMRQMLQCLMCNPPDLHPLAVAEDVNLFWSVIWFWGSVYRAVQDTCNKATLDAIYHSLGQNIKCSTRENPSAMAAFPESAAGEWRIACGSEVCPQVDHEVKFNICAGCNVRRYCDVACQKEDWAKHIKFCAAAKKRK